jgi:hypothetical protein
VIWFKAQHTYLAVGCGQGQAIVGPSRNDESRAELDGEASGGCDLGKLHTDGLDDGVPVRCKPNHDAHGSNEEDPDLQSAQIVTILLCKYIVITYLYMCSW